MSEYLGTQDVVYICGRPFTSEDGQHNPGEEVPNALSFHYLESLINAGYLYRVLEEDYTKLPPHVFNAVMTEEEAKAKIEGDPSATAIQVPWNPSPELEQAQKEAEIQAEIHQNVLDFAEQGHEQAGYTDAEKVLAEEQEAAKEDTDAQNQPTTRKRAAKKA